MLQTLVRKSRSGRRHPGARLTVKRPRPRSRLTQSRRTTPTRRRACQRPSTVSWRSSAGRRSPSWSRRRTGRRRAQGHGPADPSGAPRRARRRGAALLAPRPGNLARLPRAPMGAAPAAALGSATWTLVGVLEAAWEATGTTFIGRERPALFRSRGRVAWLRATDGRSAGRWRAAAPRTVSGGTGSSRRNRRASTGFGPGRWRAGGHHARRPDPRVPHRPGRGAHRARDARSRGPPRDAARGLLCSLVSASVADLRPPIRTDRPPEFRTHVARALVVTPLGLAAARCGPATARCGRPRTRPQRACSGS